MARTCCVNHLRPFPPAADFQISVRENANDTSAGDGMGCFFADVVCPDQILCWARSQQAYRICSTRNAYGSSSLARKRGWWGGGGEGGGGMQTSTEGRGVGQGLDVVWNALKLFSASPVPCFTDEQIHTQSRLGRTCKVLKELARRIDDWRVNCSYDSASTCDL